MQDPSIGYEQREFLEELIRDVVKLPSKQRFAMICLLKDEIGTIFPLSEAFKHYGIDIQNINWPREASELHRSRSSLSVARKTLIKKYKRLV